MNCRGIRHELIRRYARSNDAHGMFEAAATLVPLGLLWVFAAWTTHHSLWLTGVAVIVMALFNLRALALMHECGHGSLFRSTRWNRLFGFTFGVLVGLPQYVWSQHHRRHHAHNGNWQRHRGTLNTVSTEEYSRWNEQQRRAYRQSRHLAMAPLAGCLYLLVTPRLIWIRGSAELLAYMARCWTVDKTRSFTSHARNYRSRYWQSPREYRHMMLTNLAFLGFLALIGALWGAVFAFAVFAGSVSLAGGAAIVLFSVQHNFEHSYASDCARWDPDAATFRGTSFLIIPRWLDWFVANAAYHHVHHLSQRIPTYHLAECHRNHAELFSGVTRVKLSEIAGAVKCILWDPRAQRMISVAEYERGNERLQLIDGNVSPAKTNQTGAGQVKITEVTVA